MSFKIRMQLKLSMGNYQKFWGKPCGWQTEFGRKKLERRCPQSSQTQKRVFFFQRLRNQDHDWCKSQFNVFSRPWYENISFRHFYLSREESMKQWNRNAPFCIFYRSSRADNAKRWHLGFGGYVISWISSGRLLCNSKLEQVGKKFIGIFQIVVTKCIISKSQWITITQKHQWYNTLITDWCSSFQS